MKLRRNKKGFTIIELVIVIAVIGVLTAILVPTFINLTRKANEASDKSLVDNLNKQVEIAKGEGKEINTLHDAVLVVEDAGYKLPNLVAKSDTKILWNQETDRFLLEEDKESKYKDYQYWAFQDTYNPETDVYSVYAGKYFADTNVHGLKVGFDVGYHDEIKSVEYVGGEETKERVLVRFNNDQTQNFVNNNSTSDKVYTYGNINDAISTKSGQESLYINGNVSTLEVKEGHVVLGENSTIGLIVFAKTGEKSFDKIVIEKAASATIEEVSRSSIGVELGEELIEVATVKTSGSSETIFLKGNGTIEDAQLYVSTDGTKASAQPVSEQTASDTARAIANAKVAGEVEDGGLTREEIVEKKDEVQTEKQNEIIEQKEEESGEDYAARIGIKGYATLAKALEEAKPGETIVLLKDLSLNKISNSDPVIISVTKDLVINGNGKQITSPNATRGIWVASSDVKLTVKNLTLSGTVLERAIQINSGLTGVQVTLDNVDFESSYYCFNICANVNNSSVVVKNSTLKGWSALNSYASYSSISFIDSTLIGVNKYSSASNDYATIVLDGNSLNQAAAHSNSYHASLNIQGCTIIAKELGTNKQRWINFQYGACSSGAYVSVDSNTSILDDYNGNNKVYDMYITGDDNEVVIKLTQEEVETFAEDYPQYSLELQESGAYRITCRPLVDVWYNTGYLPNDAFAGLDFVIETGIAELTLDNVEACVYYPSEEAISPDNLEIEGSKLIIKGEAIHKLTNGDFCILVIVQ